MKRSKKITAVAAGLAGALFVGGCADMTPTQQRATTGALGGAAAGSIIGAMAGNAGMGAGIGAGVGLLGGYAFGRHQDAVNRAYQQGRQSGAQGR
jgi:hypothetical protein